MDDEHWPLLRYAIAKGRCTPFLGAGASADIIPVAKKIALDWAKQYGYPYPDKENLGAVAQFLADRFSDVSHPKRLLSSALLEAQALNPPVLHEPHDVLAELPITTYVTTNYDDLMRAALLRKGKTPRVELCRWNAAVTEPSVFDDDYEPSVEAPVVYHLHGHQTVPESLVLTDDDYLDFLLAAFSDRMLIPPVVQGALAGRSLLFIGYRLNDWNFRMLFRRFAEAGVHRTHFAVLRPPRRADDRDFQLQIAHFIRLGIRPYYGTAAAFGTALRQAWSA